MESEISGLVSVVIPTYNDDPDHLRDAVASALGQTYTPIEVIVVDDGSTRADLIKALESMRGVTLVRQPNAGVSTARNAGARQARGEFIQLLDGDDWLDPHFVAEAVQVLRDGAVMAHADRVVFGEGEEGHLVPMPRVRLQDLMRTNRIPVAAMVRRSRWVAIGGFDEDLRGAYEDWEFWVRVLRAGGESVLIPSAHLHYRVRPTSTVRSIDGPAALEATRAAIRANNPWWVFIKVRFYIAYQGKRAWTWIESRKARARVAGRSHD